DSPEYPADTCQDIDSLPSPSGLHRAEHVGADRLQVFEDTIFLVLLGGFHATAFAEFGLCSQVVSAHQPHNGPLRAGNSPPCRSRKIPSMIRVISSQVFRVSDRSYIRPSRSSLSQQNCPTIFFRCGNFACNSTAPTSSSNGSSYFEPPVFQSSR